MRLPCGQRIEVECPIIGLLLVIELYIVGFYISFCYVEIGRINGGNWTRPVCGISRQFCTPSDSSWQKTLISENHVVPEIDDIVRLLDTRVIHGCTHS